MVGVLIVLLVVVPIVELTVIVTVAGSFGVLPTLAILVLFSVAGGWLLKREGTGVWRRIRAQLGRGEVPAAALVDGLLLLVGGLLMLTPGFVTDTIGLLLLVSPVRAGVRLALLHRFQRRVEASFSVPGAGGLVAGPFGPTVEGVVVREYVGDVVYDVAGRRPDLPVPGDRR